MKNLFLFLFIFVKTGYCFRRQLTVETAPGCFNCSYPVYYVKALGPNDTLHYIWDFTSKPTVFLAMTKRNVTATFNWSAFAANNKSINFDSPPNYSFSLVLNKLIQFNDVEDTGILTSSTDYVSYDTKYFKWKQVHNDTTSTDFVTVTMSGSNFADGMMVLDGTVLVELTAFGSDGHDFPQPRLVHSENTTQCKLVLDKLHSNADYNSSRYAVEMIMVSSDNRNLSSRIRSRMNLDDENSPGVFSVIDLTTPQSQDHQYKGAFLQWRPVAFTNEIPSLINSTEVLTYNITSTLPPEDELRDTLIYKYYGHDYHSKLIQQTIVSLGFAEDGFYKKTNYSSWTFTVNYGSPENEKFSLLVIMVMAIGLGLPVVLILIGGSYMLGRRLRNKNISLSR